MTSSPIVPDSQNSQMSAGHESGDYDVVIVGAGFAGLYMLHRIRELGLRGCVIEAGGDVGGTWYWNRYPGARVDVESIDYCYGFTEDLMREWKWSERFCGQAEVLSYLDFVAKRFDLHRDIKFSSKVTAAHFVEDSTRWRVLTDQGDEFVARFCVMATGPLSLTYTPPFSGAEKFQGEKYHTGRWPHSPVDFTGKRVAVIGTGSSGIQVIPEIARTAEHVTVLQRTPNFSLPAQNHALGDDALQHDTGRYLEWKNRGRYTPMGNVLHMPAVGPSVKGAPPEEVEAELESRWQFGGTTLLACYRDVLTDHESNEIVCEFVRSKIRQIVTDPDVAELLSPRGYPIGSKRICVDTGYYATYNRDNVSLIDVRSTPITGITETGVATEAGDWEVDVIVFATGYDAMSGPMLNIDIRGRDGWSLRDEWADGPAMYLGLAVAGFPNLFGTTGPGSPSVRVNMASAVEQHVEWITECLRYMESNGLATIEAEADAQAAWTSHVAELADATVFAQADSWYLGANIPGKPRVFMPYVGGLDRFRQRCDEVAAAGYEGFVLRALDGETRDLVAVPKEGR
jgi:cyclohexanone monooxygenase